MNIKTKVISTAFLAFSLFFASCTKDKVLVDTTAPVGPAVIVPPVAPPTAATDSTLVMGNPSNATSNTADFSNYLLKEGYYSLSYNRDRGIANWVSWHVVATDLGPVPRQDNFRANPSLPVDWYHVDNLSYSSSGFDRGHMCPSSDRTSSVAANSSTFLMTNMIPQAPRNNQITWAALEDYTRTLVQSGNEVYIISGAFGEGGSTTSGGLATSIDNGRIVVPSYVWKTIVVLTDGSNDLNRVNNSTRVISVVIPNTDAVNSDWKTYRTSVDFIEQETGFDLLSKVSTAIQNTIEARIDNL
jgi:endonuclease G